MASWLRLEDFGVTAAPDDLPYASCFDALLDQEGLADPALFAEVEVYDEVPLYSRLSQLQFLAGLPIQEQNRQLVRTAVRHLDRIRENRLRHSSVVDKRVLRLISVTGWWVDAERDGICTDGTSELILPNFWLGNLDDERMKDFKLYLPTSRPAIFVSEALSTSEYQVFESALTESTMWCPMRVYVGFPGDIPSEIVAAQATFSGAGNGVSEGDQ